MGQFLDEPQQAATGRFLDEDAPAAPSRGVGQILWDNLKATPGRMVDLAVRDAKSGAKFVSDFRKPSVALPTVVAGPAGGPLTRTALGAASRALPGALSRIGGATIGGGMEGGVKGAAKAGGITAAFEAAFPIVGKLLRGGLVPGVGGKTRIAESRAKGVADVMTGVAPEMEATLAAAKQGVAPGTRGPTAAALEEVALGTSGKNTAGDIMERGMLDTTLAAQGSGVTSPSLVKFWQTLPSGNVLADELKRSLAPSPNGTFTVSQAERLLAELGNRAYPKSGSPINTDISELQLHQLYEKGLQETVSGLPAQAAGVFAQARDKFKGVTSLLDMIRTPGARQGFPNRVMLNEPKLQQHVSENRAEMRRALGPHFDALEGVLYGGGQLGTRSVLAPGTGETTAALHQVFGRGQGGAPQMIGGAVRTAAPNVGSQYTGQQPLEPPHGLKALIDALGIRLTAPEAQP